MANNRVGLPPPLTLTLIYSIEPGPPELVGVLREASFIPTEDALIEDFKFSTMKDGPAGLQLLLCNTWLERDKREFACPKLVGPSHLVRPLHSAARLNNNPIPRKAPANTGDKEPPDIKPKKELKWRDEIFATDPKDIYLRAHYKPDCVTATNNLTININIQIGDSGSRPATPDEVMKIAFHLQGADCDGLNCEINVKMGEKPHEHFWRIRGDDYETSLFPDCEVFIKTAYSKPERLVMWLSNDSIWEVFPDPDEEISEGLTFKRVIDPVEGHVVRTPANDLGLGIDSPAGVEACIVAICPKKTFIKKAIKSKILEFFDANPLSQFQPDSIPTRRSFTGRCRENKRKVRNLRGIRKMRAWDSEAFEKYLPEGTLAVMLTMPISR